MAFDRMPGASLQVGRRNGEHRFYDAFEEARRSRRDHRRQCIQSSQRYTGTCTSVVSPHPRSLTMDKAAMSISGVPEQEDRVREKEVSKKTGTVTASCVSASSGHPCNLERFLKSTTPVVTAQYPSKMKMGGCRDSDGESRPYFALADLWESFAEWSAYGAGVPLVLNGTTSVIQYYVPFLSGIQLYGALNRPSNDCRRPGDESDGDSYWDSSSCISSDHEHENEFRYSKGCDSEHVAANLTIRMHSLCLREKHWDRLEGSSSDDGDCRHSQSDLLFEYLEHDPPFVRVPLFDKISDLAGHFPALKSLRSCDLLPSSWISVAWYPIYRIPTGPSLRDLDACFLTFHSLSTPMKERPTASAPQRVNGVPIVTLPTFGLAPYKFRGSIWTPNGGAEFQLVSSLRQAAENWVRYLNVDHPDYCFFASRSACWR
ncbi:uncharacterized protein LOC141831683 isoform X2 [Curcuma longa]|uniref:uncharacterized protein LOC141831683 isoform X2 n=1 Tax=Curcuma longa TaxID=136217 RepID=UPI003D9E51C0